MRSTKSMFVSDVSVIIFPYIRRYDDFVKAIPKDEPRYCIVDFAYQTEDGRPQEKLVFIFW